jgi:mxaA protein
MRLPAKHWPDIKAMKATLTALALLLLTACENGGKGTSTHGLAEATRDYGYVIGDVIHMVYRFDLQGDEIDQGSLPPKGALTDWLILRDTWVEKVPHRNGVETRLHLNFQTFKGIKEPENLSLPALSFRLVHHPETPYSTDAWSFTQVPVLPPDQTNETVVPQAGIDIPRRDVHAPSRGLALWSVGIGLISLLIVLRHRIAQRKHQPFRSSASLIRTALRQAPSDDRLMEGLRLFHRAFDQTFGRTLFKRDIPDFLRTHPTFADVEGDLDTFFKLSAALFFNPSDEPISEEAITTLLRLLTACIQAERAAL